MMPKTTEFENNRARMVILIKINLKKLNKKNKYFSPIYINKELKFK
jgi:hypothetical protein